MRISRRLLMKLTLTCSTLGVIARTSRAAEEGHHHLDPVKQLEASFPTSLSLVLQKPSERGMVWCFA